MCARIGLRTGMQWKSKIWVTAKDRFDYNRIEADFKLVFSNSDLGFDP